MCKRNTKPISGRDNSAAQWLAILVLTIIIGAISTLFYRSDYNLQQYNRASYNDRYTTSNNSNTSIQKSMSIPHEHGEDNDITFEGSSNFLTLLRQAHQKKVLNPLPHCHQQHNISADSRIRPYNRAIEIDFVGKERLNAVRPTWSSTNTSSCHFTALSFPPTDDTLESALQQTTYITSYYTKDQCTKALNWNEQSINTCLANNWGGTLGSAKNIEDCISTSVGGYPIKQWLNHSSTNAVECLTQFLKENSQYQFDIAHIEGVPISINITDFFFGDAVMGTGYGATKSHGVYWYAQMFIDWSKAVLLQGSNNDTNKDNVENVIIQIGNILKGDRNSTKPLTQCVDKLLPPSQDHTIINYWKERGVHMTVSTLSNSPSALLQKFSGSLGGVLPSPPTAVYSKDAILETLVVHLPNEIYVPGCTPYWSALFNEKKAREPQKHLPSCSSATNQSSSSNCPYPTYDLVIDVSQVYCIGFFHFTIEVWPRIAPFLDALLAEDMPPFAIRLGCAPLADFHQGMYELLGLENVTLLDETTVHAKEVITPTEGFSHSPLLNYWNLVALRKHVRRRLGDTTTDKDTAISNSRSTEQQQKIVMVIIRDASRRGDTNIYNEKFLQQLSNGLGSGYNVTAFRSSDEQMMGCMACQVRAFMEADVIVGSHGAGLSHAMFAKPGAIIMERIVGGGDSGIYAELAFLNQMKYFAMGNNAQAQAYYDIILFADSL